MNDCPLMKRVEVSEEKKLKTTPQSIHPWGIVPNSLVKASPGIHDSLMYVLGRVYTFFTEDSHLPVRCITRTPWCMLQQGVMTPASILVYY